MNTVVLVDDHPFIRMALKISLEERGYEIVGEASNGVDAVQMVRELKPTLAIIDIGIPKMDGLEVISRINNMNLGTKVLVLSAQPADVILRRVIQAGAAGYVSKEKDLSEVVSALDAIRRGNLYLPMSMHQQERTLGSKSEADLIASLSDREFSVFKQLVSGRANKDIANDLFLSSKTVSTYKTRLFNKLNVINLSELIKLAERNGVI